MTVVWSYDDGYGDGKLFDGENELLIPSYITLWRPKMKQELQKQGKTVSPLDYITIEVEEQKEIDGEIVLHKVKYLVGRGAIQQDTKSSAILGENKHLDKRFKYLLMASLGLLAKSEATFVDLLSMGLPVDAEEDPSRHELLNEMIVGKPMKFTLELADGTVLPRTIQVQELMIRKQPFGSHADVFLDLNGDFTDEGIEYVEAFVNISDIGAGTFNKYTLDELDPVKDLSNNTNDGMFVAYQEINDKIEELTGYRLADALLPYTINEKGSVNGHDLRVIRHEAYDNHANKIAGIIESTFRNDWARLKVIILTGGGAVLLRPFLEKYLAKRPIIFLDRFATARGLYKLAKREINRRKPAPKTPARKRDVEKAAPVSESAGEVTA